MNSEDSRNAGPDLESELNSPINCAIIVAMQLDAAKRRGCIGVIFRKTSKTEGRSYIFYFSSSVVISRIKKMRRIVQCAKLTNASRILIKTI